MRGDEELGIIKREEEPQDIRLVRSSGKPLMRIFRAEGTRVVLGHGSRIKQEIHIDRIRTDGIHLERRSSGGCAVVVDEGNVIVSVTLPVEGLGETKKWFQRSAQWLAHGLNRVGIENVGVKGISDIVIGDRKIAGTAVHRAKGIFTFGASLLVTADLTLLERYLTHPPREPEYRAGRSHLDFVTSLQQAAGIDDVDGFMEQLESALLLEDLLDDSATYVEA